MPPLAAFAFGAYLKGEPATGRVHSAIVRQRRTKALEPIVRKIARSPSKGLMKSSHKKHSWAAGQTSAYKIGCQLTCSHWFVCVLAGVGANRWS